MEAQQETLAPKPAAATATVACALCGERGLAAEMTTDGDGKYYCGHLSPAALEEFRAEVKACDDRQLAARRAALADELTLAVASPPLDESDAAAEPEPAKEDTTEPATEVAEAPAGETT